MTNKLPKTELAYLAAISDVVTVEDWRDLLGNTLTAAKEGDKAARDYITKLVIGNGQSLSETAKMVAMGIDDNALTLAKVAEETTPAMERLISEETLHTRASKLGHALNAE